ncbi:serine/threonine protein kinase, partial [Streptomyces sp. SID11233]|nr:serine/threonine protein kinase [Streptomyces sp. SID11233]
MPPPQRIGRYLVQRRLGSGAFAVVWLAQDERLQAPVAVKVLADNWAGRLDIRERFLSEARLLRQAGSGGV